MRKTWWLAGALMLGTCAHAQLPPGDGPTPLSGGLVDPTPLLFDDALLAHLKVPAGFRVNVFARGLQNIRWMQAMPNGDVYVSRRQQGDVLRLRDANKDGVMDEQKPVATNMPKVHGLALRDRQLYMVTDKKVFVADLKPNGDLSQPRQIVDDLPDAGQHPARTLAFGPDGRLYVTIGSTCNNCDEANPENATVVVMKPDGSARTVYAKGLRHTVGFGWHPTSGALWGFDHGSDDRGDDQPPEELNRIEQNKDYGWPWCYGDNRPDPLQAMDPPNTSKADFCPTATPPVLGYTAHAAPIGMLFYTGAQFPAEYRNDAFVAMRGSWNRTQPSGYRVVRVRFNPAGEPQQIEDFATGWLVDKPGRPARFGRLAGLAVHADGSLLVADDENGVVYRISHGGR